MMMNTRGLAMDLDFRQAVVFPSVSHIRACINKEGQRQVSQNTNPSNPNPKYQSIKYQSKIPIHQIPIQQYRSKITIHQIPNASSHKSLYRHRGSTQIPSTHNKTARMPIHHPNKIHQSQIANTSSHFWILVST